MIGECKSCLAFTPAPEAGPGAGYCRRHPPVAVVMMGRVAATPANPQGVAANLTGQFPPVHERGGCCDCLPKKITTN